MLSLNQKAQVVNPDSPLFGKIGTIVKWIAGPTPDIDGFIVLFPNGEEVGMAREESSARIVFDGNPPRCFMGGLRGDNESPHLALLSKLSL